MKQIKLSFCLGLAGLFLTHTSVTFAENAKLVTGTKLENRVMQNQGDHFAFHDGRIWAQVELKPSDDGHVTFVWTRNGHPYHELKVATKKSDRYRVAGYVTALIGKWHVAVKSDDNHIVAEKDFVVGAENYNEESELNDSGTTDHAKKEIDKEDLSVSKKNKKPKVGMAGALKAISPSGSKEQNPSATSETTAEITSETTAVAAK
jgi:hypothetical protein